MTADTNIMRDAASRVADEKKKYDSAIEELNQLIVVTLGKYWGDEAYDELKQKYETKSRNDLRELSETLGEFSKQITTAADDLDKAIGSLRG